MPNNLSGMHRNSLPSTPYVCRAKQAQAHLGPAPSVDGEEATIWYFAYGSNMNKKVFQGRRLIKPAESVAAVLPGWQLTFNQPGLPFIEPAFAAVERKEDAPAAATANGSAMASSTSGGVNAADGGNGVAHAAPDVHGVAYRITPSQWAYVLETEGGSTKKGSESGYSVVEAGAVDYEGRQLTVLTLSVPPHLKARLKASSFAG
jgi:hypothetical protein